VLPRGFLALDAGLARLVLVQVYLGNVLIWIYGLRHLHALTDPGTGRWLRAQCLPYSIPVHSNLMISHHRAVRHRHGSEAAPPSGLLGGPGGPLHGVFALQVGIGCFIISGPRR